MVLTDPLASSLAIHLLVPLEHKAPGGYSDRTLWLIRSSSSPRIPFFLLTPIICRLLSNIPYSTWKIVFLIHSLLSTSLTRLRAESNSCRNFLSFSVDCASVRRVLRTCRTSRRRKQTYGSPSSLSCPCSNYCNQVRTYSACDKGGTNLKDWNDWASTTSNSLLFPMRVYHSRNLH